MAPREVHYSLSLSSSLGLAPFPNLESAEQIFQTKVGQEGTFESCGAFSRFGIPTTLSFSPFLPLRVAASVDSAAFLVDFGPLSLSLSLSPCGSRWRREGGDARSLARCCGRRARSSPYNYGVMVLPWAEGRKEGTGERTTSMRESKGGGRGASTCCSTTTEAPTTPTTTTTGFQIAPNRLKSEAPKVGHAQRTFPPSLPTRGGTGCSQDVYRFLVGQKQERSR